MKRTRMMGLCVVAAMAVIAFSAMAASSASASSFYKCVAQKKGEYTTSTCATKSVKAKKGHFEKKLLAACLAQKKGEYTTSTCATKSAKPKKGHFEKAKLLGFSTVGGAAKLKTPGFGSGEIVCTSSTGTGKYLDSKNASFQIKFEGCTFEGLKCQSFGPNSTPSGTPGIIETNLLNAKLLGNPEELKYLDAETNTIKTYAPVAGEVGLETVSKEHEPYSSELECGGVVFLRTYGEDTGVFEASSVGKPLSSFVVAFKAKVGANGLLTEVLTEAGWAGPAPSIEEAGLTTISNESLVEIRA
jgi:hypothetical protein